MNYWLTKILLSEWTLGKEPHYGGWHCSWCFPPQGIRTKLQSAQRDDKPRWGDYPDKLDLQYIAGLVRTGQWFDGKHPFQPVRRNTTPAELYAPPYFLEQEERFSYLLEAPKTWSPSDSTLTSTVACDNFTTDVILYINVIISCMILKIYIYFIYVQMYKYVINIHTI